MLNLIMKQLDNRKTYTLCAFWFLAYFAQQQGFITHDLYVSIFGQTGPVFPGIIATLRSAIGDNK